MFAGRPAASPADRGIESNRRRDRPDRLLHLRRVGHHKSACREERGVLHMLRGALSRHRVQHHPAPQDPLLHGESDNTVRGHILSVGVGILPAERQRREGLPVNLDTPLVDGVLPAAGRDNTAHVADGAAPGQVPAVHDGDGDRVGGRHDSRAEREFPLARHPPYGQVGADSVHPGAAAFPPDQATEEGRLRRRGSGQKRRRDQHGRHRRRRHRRRGRRRR